MLKEHNVQISMDGKGRWLDNVFVERLWRSVKYEDIYLHAYETPAALRAGLQRYFQFYNERRRHSALNRRTPHTVYLGPGRAGDSGLITMEIPLKRVSKIWGPLLTTPGDYVDLLAERDIIVALSNCPGERSQSATEPTPLQAIIFDPDDRYQEKIRGSKGAN